MCGDSLVLGNEMCDDNNEVEGDGCTLDCLSIEPGYFCEQGTCIPYCYNSLVEYQFEEACDDGNDESFDGCSSECQVEPGYECDESGCKLKPGVIKPKMDIQPVGFS